MRRGIEANTNTIDGRFLLSVAVKFSDVSTIKLLLNKGANVNRTMKDGSSVLHTACSIGSEKKVNLLLDFGADARMKNEKGKTPFSLVKHKNRGAALVMIKHLAKLNSKQLAVDEQDMQDIYGSSEMHAYYKKCISEIDEMRVKTLYGTISYEFVCSCNENKLITLMKNDSFKKALLSEEVMRLFPIHGVEIVAKLKRAQDMQESLHAVEDFLNLIFHLHLPSAVTEKIATYLNFKPLFF